MLSHKLFERKVSERRERESNGKDYHGHRYSSLLFKIEVK